MLGFSEYLQHFMKINSISMVELSKETNIDRTVIYRYVKGTRVPSDINIVIRIADAMQMSISEKNYLLKEYDKLVLGETIVYSYQYIQKLLQSLEKLGRRAVSMGSQWRTIRELKMEAPMIELRTREEIVTCILDLFQYIAESGGVSKKIFLVMQPIYNEIQRFIPQTFWQSNVNIEQIVCLEQNINQSYKNLEVFHAILPLCFSLPGYNVYYYYDSLSNHLNSMTSMPNMLIVWDYVVQFDYEMEHGIVVKSDIYTEVMSKQYNAMRKKSCSLLVRGNTMGMINSVNRQMSMENGGCLFEQPCVGNCMDRDMLDRHIYPASGKEKIIDFILDMHGDWNDWEYTASEHVSTRIVSYGSHKALEEFMDTGHIKEFPETLYSPLSPDERMLVLERMIILAKSERVHYRFISERVELPGKIQIYWDEESKRIVLNQITDEEMQQVVVNEQSIYRTFQLYLEYLDKKEMVCREKEGLGYLFRLQKKYEGMRV